MKRWLVFAVVVLVVGASLWLATREEADSERETVVQPASASTRAKGRVIGRQLSVLPYVQIFGEVVSTGGGSTRAQVCVTAADGRQVLPACAWTKDDSYSIDLRPGRYDVTATADGHLPTARGILLKESVRADFVLAPGGVALTGRVEDATGGPVEAGWLGADCGSRSAGSMTDAEGRFRLWVPAGECTVTAAGSGYARASRRVVAPRSDLVIRLMPGASCAGVVVEGDARVSGAKVTASRVDWVSGAIDHATVSGGDGRFAFEGLEPGRYGLSAATELAFGRADASIGLGVGEHRPDLVIEVHPGGAILASVVKKGGDECPEGTVTLLSALGHPAQTNIAAGEASFSGLPRDTYEVSIDCQGTGAADPSLSVEVSEGETTRARWVLSNGHRASGLALDGSGRPADGVKVHARRWSESLVEPEFTATVVSNAQGEFVFESVPTGEFKFVAGGRNFEADNAVHARVDGAIDDLRLTVAPTGGIDGVVVDAETSRPLTGVAVELAALERFVGANSDEDGKFEFSDLAEGEYEIRATPDSAGLVSAPWGTTKNATRVTVTAGEPNSVTLKVDRSAEIHGTVVHAQGPVEDAVVVAVRSDGRGEERNAIKSAMRFHRPILSGSDGGFQITGLAPGTYAVLAQHEGRGEAMVRTEAGSDARPVEIQLESDALLSGTVIESGAPAAAFQITVQNQATGLRVEERFWRSQGLWRFDDLPSGTYDITAITGTGQAETRAELLPGKPATVRLEIESFGAVKGRVVDAESGQPVRGVSVYARKPRGNQIFGMGGAPDPRRVTDDKGEFFAVRVPVPEASLLLMAQFNDTASYPNHEVPVEVKEGEVADLGDIPLPRHGTPPTPE